MLRESFKKSTLPDIESKPHHHPECTGLCCTDVDEPVCVEHLAEFAHTSFSQTCLRTLFQHTFPVSLLVTDLLRVLTTCLIYSFRTNQLFLLRCFS